MKCLYSIILLIAVNLSSALCQTREYKNAIYGNLGFLPVSFGISTINAERYLFGFGIKQKIKGSVSIRLGYGSWGDWGGEGKAYLGSFHFLSGHKKHHLEFGLGLVNFQEDIYDPIEIVNPDGTIDFVFNEKSTNNSSMGINAGYRYTSKYFLFRVGASWPETLYLGLGVTF
ncbi:MAG: hypothetical protein AAFN93_01935 [Bacteroidota bacterium]